MLRRGIMRLNRIYFESEGYEMELDRTDHKLLGLLQNDARLMNKQLSAEVGLAPSSCHERIKRLWADGVLTESRAMVDPEKLGYAISVVVMAKISKEGQINIDSLMDELIKQPEIQQIHLVTGRYDLIIYMIARSMDHLKVIARSTFSDSDEISSFEVSIAYDARWDLTVPVSRE